MHNETPTKKARFDQNDPRPPFSTIRYIVSRDKLRRRLVQILLSLTVQFGFLPAGISTARSQPVTPVPSTLSLELTKLLADECPGLRDVKLDERLGIVTLSAVASDLPARRQAVSLLRSATRVLQVLDLVVVRTFPRPDPEIAEALLSSLEQVGPKASAVTVRVDRGVVELSGKVESLALRGQLDEMAATVPGVRDVVNLIEVDPYVELPSQKLPEDIAWALPFDSSTVTLVRQGETVILRGILLSREQVDRLVQAMLRQPGVARVVSELEVKNPFEKIQGLPSPE
jgi:BON domain-containing protein